MMGRMFAGRCSLAALLMSLLTLTASAQERSSVGEAALHEIYNALQARDVERLTSRAANRVDLTIFGSSELLSRSQAKYVVQEFVRTYPPVRIKVNDTSPSDGNWFSSASYWYENADEPLTVYVRLREKSSQDWELRELRFGRSSRR